MATDTTVNNLIINKLTKAQYEAIASPSDTELYLVPDEIDSTPTSASTNPVTSGGVYTALGSKQDTLVSGTNIKTVNNTSLLGSGNITIEGGGGSGEENVIEAITFNGTSATIDSSTKTAAISYTPPVTSVNGQTGAVTVSTGIPIVTQTASSVSINPNCLNQWGEIATLTITLATPTDNTIVNEYMIEFTSGSTATTLSLPSSLSWYGLAPSIEANKTYQISIINNVGVWGGA